MSVASFLNILRISHLLSVTPPRPLLSYVLMFISGMMAAIGLREWARLVMRELLKLTQVVISRQPCHHCTL